MIKAYSADDNNNQAATLNIYGTGKIVATGKKQAAASITPSRIITAPSWRGVLG